MKSLKQYLKSRTDFAIGAFNFNNFETLKGICEGCKRTKSPAFLCVSESTIKFLGREFLLGLVQAAKNEFKLPLFLHLDHGKDFEICKWAVDNNFDSVMIDGSTLSFDENVRITKKVCDYAHKKDVFVEAELGHILGKEDNISSSEQAYTNPLQAKEFVEKTKCDSLAVAIGTSHGIHKFDGTPKIRFDILKEIEKQIPNTPLVLHGASAVPKKFVEIINKNGGNIDGAKGIPEIVLQKAAKETHIFKINTDTDIRLCSTAMMRKMMAENPKNIDLRVPNSKIIEEIANFVAEKNKIQNCENRA